MWVGEPVTVASHLDFLNGIIQQSLGKLALFWILYQNYFMTNSEKKEKLNLIKLIKFNQINVC